MYQQYIKLNTNESPYPPSPEVFWRLNTNEIKRLNLYPDPQGIILKEKLAKLYGVEKENIFGTQDQRQFSVAMTQAQEDAFGPGSEVYEGGNTKIYEGLKAKE